MDILNRKLKTFDFNQKWHAPPQYFVDNPYQNKKTFTPLKNSLVHLGYHPLYQDITPPNYLQIHYKTGTLAYSGVNSAAGYITDLRTKKTYSFVIMAKNTKKVKMTYKESLTTPILSGIIKAFKKS